MFAIVVAALVSMVSAVEIGQIERDGVKSMNSNQDLAKFVEQPKQEDVTPCSEEANRAFWATVSDKRIFGTPSLREGMTFDACMVKAGYTIKP